VQGGTPLRRPLAALGDRIVEVDAEGTRVLVLREDAEDLARREPSSVVRLLPGFDPCTLSVQREAEPLLPIARRPLVSRTAGWISAILLVGGRIEGTWTHEIRRGRLAIRVAPWRGLSGAERRAIDEEADRIGLFLDASPGVEVGPPG